MKYNMDRETMKKEADSLKRLNFRQTDQERRQTTISGMKERHHYSS